MQVRKSAIAIILASILLGEGCHTELPVKVSTPVTSFGSSVATTEIASQSTLSGTEPATTNATPATPSYKGQVIPAQAGEGPTEIWVDKYDCSPNVLIVKAGTTVTWTNYDYISFTVVSDDGLFAGNMTPDKGTWSYRFDNPGSFGYSVDPYNAELQGQVIVVK